MVSFIYFDMYDENCRLYYVSYDKIWTNYNVFNSLQYMIILLVILLNPVIFASFTFLGYPEHCGAPVAPQAYTTPHSNPSFIWVCGQECMTLDHKHCIVDIIYHLELQKKEKEIRSANTNRHIVTSLPQISIWFHVIL